MENPIHKKNSKIIKIYNEKSFQKSNFMNSSILYNLTLESSKAFGWLGGGQADFITNTAKKVETQCRKLETKNSNYSNRWFVISDNLLQIKWFKKNYIPKILWVVKIITIFAPILKYFNQCAFILIFYALDKLLNIMNTNI